LERLPLLELGAVNSDGIARVGVPAAVSHPGRPRPRLAGLAWTLQSRPTAYEPQRQPPM